MTNFGRRYELMAGKAGSQGFTLGGGVRPIHIAFEVEKANTKANNSARISLWNLGKEHLSQLNQKDCYVILKAGYEDHISQIFSGTVSFASTSVDGSDRKTELELVDGLVELRDSYVSVSYNGKVNWKIIFDDVASQVGATILYSQDAVFADVSNGLSFVGKVSDLMTKGCNCCGLTWTIQNGVMQVLKKNGTMSSQVYVLNASSGLVGIPAKVAIEKDKNTIKKVGWDVECFLNGAINVNDYVKLETKDVSGYYKVYSIKHSGDNMSGDWLSLIRLENTTQK